MSEAIAVEAPADPCADLVDGFHDVEMHKYLAWPLVSSSLIGMWRTRTPRYIRWLLDGGGPAEETAAKSLGSLTHTAILEPDLLEVLYVPEPEPDGEVFRTSDGKASSSPRATAAFKEAVKELEDTGRIVVTRGAWNKAMAMRDAVHAHPRAASLLRADGAVEMSGVVTDRDTGVRLKVRPDKLVNAIGANVNVKTSQNAQVDAWTHDLFKFGYFRDFAFYERALTQLGFGHRKSIALVIDSEGPKDDRVAVYEIDEGAMDAGHQLVEKYLRQIATCLDSGYWPGHSPDIRSISLPAYAWQRVDEEIAA